MQLHLRDNTATWFQETCDSSSGILIPCCGTSVLLPIENTVGVSVFFFLSLASSLCFNMVFILHFELQLRYPTRCIFFSQFSSVAQLCLTLCDPMHCSLPGSCIHGIFQARVLEWGAIAFSPGLPVHHQLLEFTQIHVHQVSDALQPSHPLSTPFPPAPNPSQHQSLF